MDSLDVKERDRVEWNVLSDVQTRQFERQTKKFYIWIYEINHKSILIEYENDKRGNYLNDPINLKSNKHLIRGDPFVYLLACLLHIRVNKKISWEKICSSMATTKTPKQIQCIFTIYFLSIILLHYFLCTREVEEDFFLLSQCLFKLKASERDE